MNGAVFLFALEGLLCGNILLKFAYGRNRMGFFGVPQNDTIIDS